MQALLIRILSVALEAIVAGVATGGVLALIRRIQVALGVKDTAKDGAAVHISQAR